MYPFSLIINHLIIPQFTAFTFHLEIFELTIFKVQKGWNGIYSCEYNNIFFNISLVIQSMHFYFLETTQMRINCACNIVFQSISSAISFALALFNLIQLYWKVLLSLAALPVNLSLLSDVDQSGKTAPSIIVKEQVNSTLRCRVRGAHPPLARVAWFLSPRDNPGAQASQAVIPASSSGPLLTDDPNIVDYSGKLRGATPDATKIHECFSYNKCTSHSEYSVLLLQPNAAVFLDRLRRE